VEKVLFKLVFHSPDAAAVIIIIFIISLLLLPFDTFEGRRKLFVLVAAKKGSAKI
jgi:hypothetical protein